MDEESKGIKPKLISGVILSGFLTFYAYYFTYLYESGYSSYFQVPSSFIEVGLSEVLKVIFILFPIVMFIFLGIDVAISASISENPIWRELVRYIIPFFIFVLTPQIFDLPMYLKVSGIIAFILLIIGELIFPLISMSKRVKGLKRKLEILQSVNESRKKKFDFFRGGFIDLFMEQIGIITFIIICFLLVSLQFTEKIGIHRAKRQEEFMVIKSVPELVVLHKYSDHFICAPFDKEKKKIEKRFYIKTIDLIAEKGFEIVTEDIGPLKVSSEKAISPQDLQKILNMISTALPPLSYL